MVTRRFHQEGGNRLQADKKKMMRLLKTARGQMDGILKMMEEDRYCIDISQQLMATEAILNKVNKEILTAHLKNCVANAETQKEKEQKRYNIGTCIFAMGVHAKMSIPLPSKMQEIIIHLLILQIIKRYMSR